MQRSKLYYAAILSVLFAVGFFASSGTAQAAACNYVYTDNVIWSGGQSQGLSWAQVGKASMSKSLGVGTQDANDDHNANDPNFGWYVMDLGCFTDGTGFDISDFEFGNGEGGVLYVGTATALKPNPGSETAPNVAGWRYAGTVPVGNHDNSWNAFRFDIGLNNFAQYRYIYFNSNGDLRGCAGNPPCNQGRAGTRSDQGGFGLVLSDIAACTTFNSPDSVAAGSVFAVGATMTNIGNATWVNSGAQPYRLASQMLTDNLTWGLNRVDMTAALVTPGEAATFNFNATAPTTPGTYTLAFGMVHEGVAHMPTMCQKQVTVTTVPPPTVTLTANPTTVVSGGASTLTWSSTNATSCTASATPANANWTGAKATGGTQSTGSMTVTTSYTLTCTGSGGSATATVRVNVAPAPTVTLTANPTTVVSGGASTLTWSSTNATSCSASANPTNTNWTGSKAAGGTQSTGALTTTTTFTLTCTGAGGTVSANATVTVTAAPVNSATCSSITTTPSSVEVGKVFSASVTMTNNGTKPWTKSGDGSPHLLGSQNPQDNTRWGLNRVEMPSTPVNPGQSVTFNFNATAPTVADTYAFDWKMLEETLEWFGDICQKQIRVTPAPLPPTLVLTAAQPSQAALDTRPSILTAFAKVAFATGGPLTVPFNSPAFLTWDSNNTNNCVTTAGSGAWPSNSRPVDGTWLSGNLVADTTYTATCSGPGGSVTDSVLVKVGTAPPSVTLSASTVSVPFDGKSVITWNSSNATRCSATAGPWTGDKRLPGGSEDTDKLKTNTTYQITCWNSEGTSASASVTVTVSGPTLFVDLKADLGGGYVDSGSGVWPLSDVDLKAITTGTASGDISYKFWCDARVVNPTISATVSPTTPADIQEQLNLCDYENQGRYFAKLSVTRAGLTAVDTVEILVARACGLVQ